MRVLIDVRPAASCGTGIGRYASMLAEVTQEGVPGHACAVADATRLRFASALEEELVLPALLEREGAKLFHSPLFHLPATLGECAGAITIHDAVPIVRPDLTSPGFARLFERAAPAASRAAVVVCPSEAARAEVTAALSIPPGKTCVVPETPGSAFRLPPEAEADAGEAGSEPFLLVVGSIEARKNPTLVLQALALAPDLPPVIFAGPVGGLELLAEADRLGVRERVRIEGWVPDAELVRLYRRAAALVFPSRHEGFGLPVIEAFATGTPVVASTDPAIREVAGDAALLVEPDDADGLVAALRRVLEDRELRETLRARGRARLAERYSPATVRAGLAAAWDRVAREVAA